MSNRSRIKSLSLSQDDFDQMKAGNFTFGEPEPDAFSPEPTVTTPRDRSSNNPIVHKFSKK